MNYSLHKYSDQSNFKSIGQKYGTLHTALPTQTERLLPKFEPQVARVATKSLWQGSSSHTMKNGIKKLATEI